MIIVKNIFVLDDKFIQPNIDSIKSIKSIKSDKIDDIVFIGYMYEKIDEIYDMISDHNYVIFDKNYGKMFWIKESMKYISMKYINDNLILYADHDIILTDEINDLDLDLVLKNKFISFDHDQDSKQNLTRIFKFDHILKTKLNHFVASGCFICTYDIYKLLCMNICKDHIYDNYVYDNYVYGNEDIIIGNILRDNNIDSCISKIKIIHPYFDHDKYNKLKIDKIKLLFES